MGTSSLAPYGALRPLTLLLKYEVRGKFNAAACLSLATGRESKAKTSALWRTGASRTNGPISKSVKPVLAVRRLSTLAKIGSAWRRFTMPATDCKTARMSEWRRIIGWLFSETTGLGGQPRMAAAQFFPQLVLNYRVGQAGSSFARDQIFPTGVRPPLQIVIKCQPLPGLSATSVILNLHTPGRGAKHRQIPGIHAMDTLVVRPTNEPGTQRDRKPFEGCAVSGTDAPGATQHQSDCRVRFKHRFQDRNPFKKRVSCSLIWAHVDTPAWMPEHFFMVDNTIEV